jgi:hypothetical protein
MVFSGGKKETTKKTTVLSREEKKSEISGARAYGWQSPKTAHRKNLRDRRKDDRERARDAPVYVARTATARARLRRETLEGARKPVGRVVGLIRGKSRVSGIEREGGRAV